MEIERKFFLNASSLIRDGVHPSVILQGCQRREMPKLLVTNSSGDVGAGNQSLDLCIKLGSRKDSSCDFLYPSTKEALYTKSIRTSPGKGFLLAGVEGLPFVDVLNPQRNALILRAVLANLVTIWGTRWFNIETKDDLAGFIWGFSEVPPPRVKEGMSIGVINRPGGLAAVKALYRALNGGLDYFLKRGVDINYIERLAQETLQRATKIVRLDHVLPFNLTRSGFSVLGTVAEKLGHSLEIEIPSPWYGDLVKLVSPFTQDPLQSEIMILFVGEREDVETAVSEGEKLGLPSQIVGKVLEKGREIYIKKQKY
ncbi:hypothetical protein [Metallosphaera hakonensis]|uniref:hypothetical protein n=1 Tax=Metallosphaera hakonensis TaxID=79601 RepID=UPI001F10FCFB|nr:hypothetical protein [Metallosphaera hakonensis]